MFIKNPVKRFLYSLPKILEKILVVFIDAEKAFDYITSEKKQVTQFTQEDTWVF